MPRTVDEGFSHFLSKLKASAPESAAAASHRRSIEQCLRSNFGLKRFVRIGSFGNGTSISGHSDVDYLACLPTNELRESSLTSLVRVRNALDLRFPNTNVRVSCPAITVPFGNRRSEITEIVIADEMSSVNGVSRYDIPDCEGGWMKASPDGHNAFVRAVDEKHGGKVKPLIRFIKAWKYFRNVPISSFYLELRVAKYAAGESTIIHRMDVHYFLERLLAAGLPSLQDPMGISGYINPCKTQLAKADALSKLETAARRAKWAREAEDAGKILEAFTWWRLLYDDEFPTYYR